MNEEVKGNGVNVHLIEIKSIYK